MIFLAEAKEIIMGVETDPTAQTEEEGPDHILGSDLIIRKVLCREAIVVTVDIIRVMIGVMAEDGVKTGIKMEIIGKVTDQDPGTVHLGLLTEGETDYMVEVQQRKMTEHHQDHAVETRTGVTDVDSFDTLLRTVPMIKKENS